jgi:hypothetical protein
MSDWMLPEQVLARWWHTVASSEALVLLHQAMCTVSYRRIGMAIEPPALLVYLLIVVHLPVALVDAGAIWSK